MQGGVGAGAATILARKLMLKSPDKKIEGITIMNMVIIIIIM